MSFKKSSTLFISSLMCLAVAPSLNAAQPKFPNKVISINARGQNISDVITDVFSQSGFNAKVSSAVTGKAQGMFVGSPQEIWNNISRAYSLVAYADGNLVRIYSAKEVTTQTYQSDAPNEVVKAAKALVDSNNKVTAVNGAVRATGVPEFLKQVEKLAQTIRAPIKEEAPNPVTPSGIPTHVASPLLTGRAYYPELANDAPYQVRMKAGRGRRFETRVYQLRYRDATDKLMRLQSGSQFIPGLVSILQEIKGINSGIRSNDSGTTYDDSRRDNRRYDRRDRRDDYGYDDDGYGQDDRDYGRRETNGPSIIADSTNNSIIIKDYPSEMAEYTALISQLDREQAIIDLELVSIVYNRDDMQDLGVNWNIGFGGLKMLFGGSNGGRPNIAGGYVWGNGDVISAQIHALQETGAMRVTDRQFISATNNAISEYNEGGQQNIRLSSEYDTDLRTLSYGLSVRVKPSIINEDNQLRVRMDINFRDTSLTSQEVDGIPTAKGPSFSLPNTIAPHGQAVMLAGRTVQFEYDKKSKVPILGDIPIFQALFSKRRKGIGTMERAVMIIPRVRAPGGGIMPSRMVPVPVSEMPPPIVIPQTKETKVRKKRSERRDG